MKSVLMVLILAASVCGFAQTPPEAPATKEEKKAIHAELKDERDAVLAACTEEAKAANCGDKVVGKGLLKCIGHHRKSNKDFKVSDPCKAAMKALKEERKRLKGK